MKTVSVIADHIYPRVTSSWFDVYYGLQAVWAMCGWSGNGGVAEIRGMLFPMTFCCGSGRLMLVAV